MTELTLDHFSASDSSITDDDLQLEIYPHRDHKNIGLVKGKYKNFSVELGEQELHGLPMRLDGYGTSLTERLSFKLKGHRDRQGKFQVFVTCLASTMVKFKLWGHVFPRVEKPVDLVSPEILRPEVFARLRNYQGDNEELQEWIESLQEFWEQWGGYFRSDLEMRLQQMQEAIYQLQVRVGNLEKKISQLPKTYV